MAHELAVMGEHTAVSLWRSPEEVLAEAQQAAKALIKVVDLKPKKVVFNGETYLEFEDWQTVSKFYGCTTKIISTNMVEYDGVRGFEATAVVIDRHQNEIGRVDSMCLSDEANWGDVPVYEWKDELDEKGQKIWIAGKDGKKRPKGTKVEVRREPKPLFQLRSMAQTRAQVKALRSIFSWVVVMAGYQPTPAEELTGNEFPPDDDPGDDPKKQPVNMPQPTQAAKQGTDERFEVTGKITVRGSASKEGTLWVNMGEHTLAIPAEAIGKYPFNVGDKMSITVVEKQGKERKFWVLKWVQSYEAAPPPEPGEVIPPEKPAGEKKPDAIDEALANGQVAFEDVEREPIGTLEETRQGVLGRKREIVIQTMVGKNKDRNNGLTWENMHKILDGMEPPVKHVSELPLSMFEQFKKIASGEVDWRELV